MGLSVRRLKNYPIWHVTADNYWDLAMTFVRMQEWYECINPKFRGHTFRLEDFMDWYVGHKDKKKSRFTYPWDWKGFNVPAEAVLAVSHEFPNHSRHEQWLFRELQLQTAFMFPKFYLIGTLEGAKGNFRHELCHALFYFDDDYREKVSSIIEKFAVPELRNWMAKHYPATVLVDELQAWTLAGWPPKKEVPVTAEMLAMRRELRSATMGFFKK